MYDFRPLEINKSHSKGWKWSIQEMTIKHQSQRDLWYSHVELLSLPLNPQHGSPKKPALSEALLKSPSSEHSQYFVGPCSHLKYLCSQGDVAHCLGADFISVKTKPYPQGITETLSVNWQQCLGVKLWFQLGWAKAWPEILRKTLDN